jgi:hypothetical protein
VLASSDCDETRALAAELALGVADGRERAAALEHLNSCAECRRFLADLSEPADALLGLAPAREPPAGFESRVLARLATHALHKPRRLRWAVALLAVALTASAITASALLAVFRGDRDLARQYQSALARVDGQYFQAARLFASDGTPVGKVFGYQGKPSWLVFIVYAPYRRGSFSGVLITTEGRQVRIPALVLDERRATWGGAIAIELRDVARVRLVGNGGEVFRARLPPGPDR